MKTIVKVQHQPVRQAPFSPCSDCPGHCCSRNLIDVCGYDAWTIARGLHLELPDFLALAQLSGQSRYSFRLDSSERLFYLVLRMSRLPDDSGRCIFVLDLPHDQVRCGIYSFRPIACRAYPFVPSGQEVVVKPRSFCAEGTWDLNLLDMDSWRKELGRHDMEFSLYAFIIARWNEAITNEPWPEKLNPRPFLTFLIKVYERLEVVREGVPAEAWPGIWMRWRQFTAKRLNPLSLKESDTVAEAQWGWWLQSVREVVAEVSQDMGLSEMSLEKSRRYDSAQ